MGHILVNTSAIIRPFLAKLLHELVRLSLSTSVFGELYFALFKTIVYIDGSWNLFFGRPDFHHTCATCYQLPSHISTKFLAYSSTFSKICCVVIQICFFYLSVFLSVCLFVLFVYFSVNCIAPMDRLSLLRYIYRISILAHIHTNQRLCSI